MGKKIVGKIQLCLWYDSFIKAFWRTAWNNSNDSINLIEIIFDPTPMTLSLKPSISDILAKQFCHKSACVLMCFVTAAHYIRYTWQYPQRFDYDCAALVCNTRSLASCPLLCPTVPSNCNLPCKMELGQSVQVFVALWHGVSTFVWRHLKVRIAVSASRVEVDALTSLGCLPFRCTAHLFAFS